MPRRRLTNPDQRKKDQVVVDTQVNIEFTCIALKLLISEDILSNHLLKVDL